MPWHASVHPELPIIETCYSGVLTPEELNKAALETLELARQHNRPRLLADCTTLTGGHSIVDLYLLAEAIKASGLTELLKEALLLPTLPDTAETVKFWETACLNRGVRVRVFIDRQIALNWLLE